MEPGDSPGWPDRNDRNLDVERGTLKLMLQHPTLFDTAWNGVSTSDFTHPAFRALFGAILSTPYVPTGWTDSLQQATGDELVRQLEIALLVEPILRSPDEGYASAYTSRLKLLTTARAIDDLKSRLQRTNPLQDKDAYDAMFMKLLDLETSRKKLSQASLGLTE